MKLALMSIFSAGFLFAGDLPQPLGFERYNSLARATLFGVSTAPRDQEPAKCLIKSIDVRWQNGSCIETIILSDGGKIERNCDIMYPTLPPKLPRDSGVIYSILPPKLSK